MIKSFVRLWICTRGGLSDKKIYCNFYFLAKKVSFLCERKEDEIYLVLWALESLILNQYSIFTSNYRSFT